MEYPNDYPNYVEPRLYKLSGQQCVMYGCSEAAIVGNFGSRLCLQHQELARSVSSEVLNAAEEFRPRSQ